MFRPLRDYLLVRPVERVKSDILIVIRDEKESLGMVERVGPGKWGKRARQPLDVKPGDTIRFGTDEGYLSFPQLEIDGTRYLVLREADVCGVVA